MSKKVNYFAHDYGARNDPKLIAVVRKCEMAGFIGGIGKGAFWDLIEMLHEAGGFLNCDDESLENLAYSLRYPIEILKIVIFECDLFVIENEKFYSKRANEGLQKMSEASERGKQLAQKRWQKQNGEKLQNNAKNMRTAYESDATRIAHRIQEECDTHCGGNASAMLNKEINKKINKNTLNPLTEYLVSEREESPISKNAEKEKEREKKRILFKKFFEKFPKKTHEHSAEIAFLSLLESEIQEISKVLPFWLEAWKSTEINMLPNAYDWLYNKRWREVLPSSTQSHPMAVQTEKIEEEKRQQRQKTEERERQKIDAQTRQKTEERAKILAYFATLSSERQKEITSKIFVPKIARNGEILLQNGIILALRDEFLAKTG